MAAVPEQSAASPIKRVFTVAPMPPEKMAYALARYSRSPDSIVDSVKWVRTHDSAKFLESFYFQYGHASIADLGHLTVCFEGISELAAIEIEDEQLWDGQARSSRYQDFSQSNVVVPPDLPETQFEIYRGATNQLMSAYGAIHEKAFQKLCAKLPRPSDMKPDTYQRNLRARAFDVARYLLPLAVPTGLGQVTSIRSLERQIRRLKASDFVEVRDIADELAGAVAHPADCVWDAALPNDPIAPTLAHHAGPDEYARKVRDTLQLWAEQNLPPRKDLTAKPVVLLQPTDHICDICATLLYPVTDRSYRELYQLASSWSKSQRIELMDLAIQGRERRDELTRHFRSAPYVFDIIMDIGAYRDLHRHRRCQQFRQDYTNRLGYEVPALVEEAGLLPEYQQALTAVDSALAQIAPPAGQYLLPFAARSRFLFKMDFAELEYISRLRSGVKGHFSYRKIAWEMKQALDEQDPSLGALVKATPPWVEDPLTR
ncbi:MAG TPA: FAD-dependent thymidylate synthase [Bryobacteraceae bacterium]|nr:FAD-dependent thymidylate synthase [Bryobacteraceae bacterium]